MQKEIRYTVLKHSDMRACFNARDYSMLDQLVCKLMDYRRSANKRDLECVVIEDDWQCYDAAWELIKEEYEKNSN